MVKGVFLGFWNFQSTIVTVKHTDTWRVSEYRWSWSSGNSAAKRLEWRQSHRHLGCHLKKMHILKFNTSCFWSLRFSLCLTSLSVPRVCKSEVVQVTSKVTRIPTLLLIVWIFRSLFNRHFQFDLLQGFKASRLRLRFEPSNMYQTYQMCRMSHRSPACL